MKNLIGLLFCLFLFVGCTENQRAKNFGGNGELTLPINEKLVNVTWKDNQLWYLTRKMGDDEKPEVYIFREKSSLGLMQGSFTITEIKQISIKPEKN